ncbi:agmatine deiminase family protein [Coralloluteibacterium thermophilus]|uniref:Agmatine/peptidylarginine deiminase n=1 Tax=Coralloluteibacterium thermophilum TaxID=2707049 RepID=A0ABV9NI56_9GAMM
MTTFRFPAEWEPQSAVVVAWPHQDTDWAERLEAVEGSYEKLVAAIAARQQVIVCVADAEVRARAARRLAAAGVAEARLRFVEIPYDDTWLRDSGPITLAGEGRFRLLDFRFTGWGGKFDATRDDQLVQGLHAQGLFGGAELETIDFALEGGAIETDGQGTLLSTWRCLHERHPEADRDAVAAILRRALRVDRVLWLDHGYLEGDDTDAHIDTLARFAAPDAIVFQACDDPADSHHAELAAMAAEIAALRTRDGRPYRLFPLPWARPIRDGERRLAASYANFLIVNGAVLMPAYDDPADAAAQAVLENAFPDHEIVPVPCRPLIWQNGSLHCVTMQLPHGLV